LVPVAGYGCWFRPGHGSVLGSGTWVCTRSGTWTLVLVHCTGSGPESALVAGPGAALVLGPGHWFRGLSLHWFRGLSMHWFWDMGTGSGAWALVPGPGSALVPGREHWFWDLSIHWFWDLGLLVLGHGSCTGWFRDQGLRRFRGLGLHWFRHMGTGRATWALVLGPGPYPGIKPKDNMSLCMQSTTSWILAAVHEPTGETQQKGQKRWEHRVLRGKTPVVVLLEIPRRLMQSLHLPNAHFSSCLPRQHHTATHMVRGCRDILMNSWQTCGGC
jgi:hypothetical protein